MRSPFPLRDSLALGAGACATVPFLFLPGYLLPEASLFYFFQVAIAEETAKRSLFSLGKWYVIALGFGVFETLLYTLRHGPDVLPVRLLFSIPAHIAFSSLARGNRTGFALGVLAHTFYNFALSGAVPFPFGFHVALFLAWFPIFFLASHLLSLNKQQA